MPTARRAASSTDSVLQDVARDHRDAGVVRALRVGRGVREVRQADLHDVMTVETGLEQLSHRRAVGHAVAHVEVCVEGDQTEVRVVAAADGLEGVPGRRVVTAEDQPQGDGRVPPRHRGRDPLGAAGLVGRVDVTEVDQGDGLGDVVPVAVGPGGVALEGGANRRRRTGRGAFGVTDVAKVEMPRRPTLRRPSTGRSLSSEAAEGQLGSLEVATCPC